MVLMEVKENKSGVNQNARSTEQMKGSPPLGLPRTNTGIS